MTNPLFDEDGLKSKPNKCELVKELEEKKLDYSFTKEIIYDTSAIVDLKGKSSFLKHILNFHKNLF